MNISSHTFFPTRFVNVGSYIRQYVVPASNGYVMSLLPFIVIGGDGFPFVKPMTIRYSQSLISYFAPGSVSYSSLLPYALIFK